MFSQPGKNSTSKFRILLEKDFILSEQFKFKYPEKKSFVNYKRPIENINKIAEEERKNLEAKKKENRFKFRQFKRSHSGNFIFRKQSRIDYYESTPKNCAPPPGTYNLTAISEEKSRPAPDFKAFSKHSENFQAHSHFRPTTPRKPLTRSNSQVQYNKQLSREDLNKTSVLDLTYNPDYSLVTQKVRIVDMEKCMPRPKFLFEKPKEVADYEPNKEYLMVGLGKVPNLSLMSKRKELFPVFQSPDPYDTNLSLKLPKTTLVDFSKMASLEVDHKSPLPSFMQTIHNRTSILYSSMKTLNLTQ